MTLPMTTKRTSMMRTRSGVQHIGSLLLLLALPALGETVAWDQPATYTDGSAIAAGEIASNTIYISTGGTTNSLVLPATNSAQVVLPAGFRHVLTVTATTSAGVEGERSDALAIDKRKPSKGKWK